MDRALYLARCALGRTSPNPAVGCVVERSGQIVGEGFTLPPGEAHAEVVALNASGGRACGATMYVTLEPCCHFGLTPPCTDAIIASGVRRVIVSCLDTDPRVAGKGIVILREAGIDVDVGLECKAARQINRGFFKFNACGLPMVTAKWAMTLDGKIATATGSSRWITGEAARAYAHELRDRHDAVLVGALTALRDDPALTVRVQTGGDRPPRLSPPWRVILDSTGRLPPSLRVFNDEYVHRTIVATTPAMPVERRISLEKAGVRVECVPANDRNQVDLEALLRRLAALGARRVLVEGGGQTLGNLFDRRLVDEVAVFVAPIVVGGNEAPWPVGGHGIEQMADALRLRDHAVRVIGGDFLVEGVVGDDPWAGVNDDERAPVAVGASEMSG